MPIYEYECGACHERTEFIQKFSESPKRKCPQCGKQRLKRLISAAAFHLKGDGWYVTDFRDKGKKKDDGESKSNDSNSETKSGKSDDKSGDRAPAASGEKSGSDSKSPAKSEAKSESKSSGKSKTAKSSPNAAAS